MSKLKLAILRNEIEDDHLRWVHACNEKAGEVDYEVIDLTRSDWLKRIKAGRFDGLLAIGTGWTTPFKILYDERVRILNKECGIPVYPSYEEILIYENKKYFSYWLEAKEIPHPATKLFYFSGEALDFIRTARFPLVAKTNLGASGSGVEIIKDKDAAALYIRNTFSGTGVKRNAVPKWKRKGFLKRAFMKLLKPRELGLRITKYRYDRSEVQKDFVIFQEFVAHDFEWRCVRIGDSYFAHKKLKVGEKASGSLVKGYETPPQKLLDFIRDITERCGFRSQAIDIFETKEGAYLVNEMQCIFGQSDPHQMLVDGVPGRYVFRQGQWRFEPGEFNRIESFLLRLEDFIEILGRSPTMIHQIA